MEGEGEGASSSNGNITLTPYPKPQTLSLTLTPISPQRAIPTRLASFAPKALSYAPIGSPKISW